jgi:hypothetical protein
MKGILGFALAAVLAFAGTDCQARGAASSSFAPRGPEPHATLADKNGRKSFAHRNGRHGFKGAPKHAVSGSPKH